MASALALMASVMASFRRGANFCGQAGSRGRSGVGAWSEVANLSLKVLRRKTLLQQPHSLPSHGRAQTLAGPFAGCTCRAHLQKYAVAGGGDLAGAGARLEDCHVGVLSQAVQRALLGQLQRVVVLGKVKGGADVVGRKLREGGEQDECGGHRRIDAAAAAAVPCRHAAAPPAPALPSPLPAHLLGDGLLAQVLERLEHVLVRHLQQLLRQLGGYVHLAACTHHADGWVGGWEPG